MAHWLAQRQLIGTGLQSFIWRFRYLFCFKLPFELPGALFSCSYGHKPPKKQKCKQKYWAKYWHAHVSTLLCIFPYLICSTDLIGIYFMGERERKLGLHLIFPNHDEFSRAGEFLYRSHLLCNLVNWWMSPSGCLIYGWRLLCLQET